MKVMNIAGPIIYDFPIVKGVEHGVLTQGVVIQITIPENEEEPNPKAMHWVYDRRLNRKVKKVNTYEHEVLYNPSVNKVIKKLASEAWYDNYAIAVLVERVAHVKRLDKLLSRYNPRLFYGAISSKERRKNVKHFEKGKADLFIANKVFTKGVNIKRLDLIMDGAQRQSKNDCMQKFGRGVRLHADKGGLLYFSLVTMPAMEKAANAQRSAFKAAKIPFKRIDWIDAKTALKEARKLIKETLKGNKK